MVVIRPVVLSWIQDQPDGWISGPIASWAGPPAAMEREQMRIWSSSCNSGRGFSPGGGQRRRALGDPAGAGSLVVEVALRAAKTVRPAPVA